jgi:hypothetical protein
MNPGNQPLPRFIPTLTEVVDHRTLSGLARPAKPETEAMVQRVKQQIQPIFERRLQEEFDRLVRATVSRHWADVSAKLQDEMEMFTRQAVIDALAASDPPAPRK